MQSPYAIQLLDTAQVIIDNQEAWGDVKWGGIKWGDAKNVSLKTIKSVLSAGWFMQNAE